MNATAFSQKTVIEHLQELRYRLMLSALSLFIGSALGFVFYKPLLQLLLSPLKQSLYYTSPAGGLSLIFTLCLIVGALFSLPFFMYQAFKFLEPAIPNFSRHLLFILVIDSCLLMFLGISFAYFISLPASLNFLSGFGVDNIKPIITTQEYFSFVSRYTLGFGILFQLPLAMLIVNHLYHLSVKKLLGFQRYTIVASFILAAILTPTPDPLNQTIMALPIIILFYLSLILVWYVNRAGRK